MCRLKEGNQLNHKGEMQQYPFCLELLEYKKEY
jgi:hypothetical protein